MILEKFYFKESLYASERIGCTEQCALMHNFLCIRESRVGRRGPQLNSLRSFSTKNLTGQAGVGGWRCAVRGKRLEVKGKDYKQHPQT